MKVYPVALAAQYSGAGSTLCQCLKMTLRDGAIVAATSIDKALVIDGVTYQPWLQVSDLVSTATLGVDNLELTVITDEDDLKADLEAGRCDNASFYLFETNYLNPADGVNGLKRGTTGEVQITDSGQYTLEFRGLTQALQQTVGIVTSRTCPAQFADFPKPALGALCRLDPNDWTVAGTISSVTSHQIVTDTSRTEADDWFGNGFLWFTSGLNANYTRQIKSFVGGVFTFTLPFPFDISIGDAYEVIAGCRKRHERTTALPAGVSDCIDKFNNIPNFQGEPHLPGVDLITSIPGVGE